MAVYQVPGRADQVSNALLAAWNAEIKRQFDRLAGGHPEAAPFLLRDPAAIADGTWTDAVHWTGDPAEPRFCLSRDWAQKLSDWGVRGRQSFHNEYCEFGLVLRTDAQGRVRPKRFVATTELAEYWLTVATHEPRRVKQMAEEVLGRPVTYAELYGPQGTNAPGLSRQRRRILFATYVAGNGRDPSLVAAQVPNDPVGDLNTRNVLFMSHPINGLDDLIYIVMFGAKPYAVRQGGQLRRAELHEIFRAGGVTHLACRNADPAAAQGAYDQVVREVDGASARGSQIAFADPLGMYVGAFDDGAFSYQGESVPADWIVRKRGTDALAQRFEFGPPDSHSAFLDDILLSEGAHDVPLTSGYQVARRLEVGPHLLIGQERQFQPQWVEIAAAPAPLNCAQADVCAAVVRPARDAYEQQQSPADPRR